MILRGAVPFGEAVPFVLLSSIKKANNNINGSGLRQNIHYFIKKNPGLLMDEKKTQQLRFKTVTQANKSRNILIQFLYLRTFPTQCTGLYCVKDSYTLYQNIHTVICFCDGVSILQTIVSK